MNKIDPKLLAPFKDSEKFTHPSTGMVHLRARVVQNRLNDVLGYGWKHRVLPTQGGKNFSVIEYMDADGIDQVGIEVTVEITIEGSSREGIGTAEVDQNSNIPYGDYIKMAEENAMFKAANKFGIGMDLYQKETKREVFKAPSQKQIDAVQNMVGWRLTEPVRIQVENIIDRLDNKDDPVSASEISKVITDNQESKKRK